MDRKILVTGTAGYIESHCVLALLTLGYDVVIVDNLSKGHIETVNTLKRYGNIIFYQCDLLNFKELKNVFKETNNKFGYSFRCFFSSGGKR